MGSFTPPPTFALSPGERLDRYELLCVLAQGGMGTVWLARLSGKHGFERLVALKTILPTYSNDRVFCDMFLDEAKIAAQIDHENVARIFEIGEDRGILYYAMELIDGHSVRKLYRDVRALGEPFPTGIALRIAADASAGLHATHELRAPDDTPLEVVHRDVSPQNLLVTIRGTTKLIDFGVAKARARRTEDTAAGTLKGKLEYMAPEQARGAALDRRADVYSVGAVLYELLAWRPVLITEDGKQLAALHDLMVGIPHEPLPARIPEIIRDLVDRALARDPAHRFASTDELRLALEQAMLATGQSATTDDVASLLARCSRERTLRRKAAIDEAVRAADEGRLAANTTLLLPQGSVPPPAVASSQQLPAVPPVPPGSPSWPLDGAGTGPSLRTMAGASVTARPPPPAPFTRYALFGVALGLVAMLGVLAGVIATKRSMLAPSTASSTTEARSSAAPTTTPSPPSTPLPPPTGESTSATAPTPPPEPAASPSPPPTSPPKTGNSKDAGTAPHKVRPWTRPGPRGPAADVKKDPSADEYGF